jgi:glycosyltransferase involved in cell wall biosynthesis
LRILHVLAPSAVGGLERVVEALALGHAARGLDMHLAVILDAPHTRHPIFESFVDSAVELHPLSLPLRAYRRERAAIRGLIERLQPDVVHTHGYRPDVVDGGIPRRLGVPAVTTVHGFTGGDLKNRLFEWLQCRAFRRFDAVLAVSRPLRDAIVDSGVGADRVHLIPNALYRAPAAIGRAEARAAFGVEEGSFHIGWVGRFGHEKGPDLVLDALPLLADLPVRLSMVGYGRERVGLEGRAEALGVAHAVRWHEGILDAGRLFRGFDVFVLSSRTEGTPIVLLEAMAAETPIVAAAVGGVPDMLSDAEALLVAPADPPRLADAVRAVHADPDAARRRARAAVHRLDAEFGAESWLRRHEAVYRDVQRSVP